MIFHIRNRVGNEMVAISAKNPPKVLIKFVLNEKKKAHSNDKKQLYRLFFNSLPCIFEKI